MTKDAYKIPFAIVCAIGRPLFWLRFRPTVVNKVNIPKRDSLIFCGNHRHKLDPFCVIYSTKRIIHYMAKKEFMDGNDALTAKSNRLIRRLNALLLKCTRAISVDREGDTGHAKVIAKEYLRIGSAIGIFPEGTRNKTINEYKLQPFKFGAVSLAKKTGAFLMPFAITGKYIKGGNLMIRFGTV